MVKFLMYLGAFCSVLTFIVSISFFGTAIKYKTSGEKIEATVSQIEIDVPKDEDDNYKEHVFVTYEFNNKEYTQELDFSKGGMQVGDTTTVYIQRSNPSKVILLSEYITNGLLAFFIGAIYSPTIYLLIKGRRKKATTVQ